MSKADHITLGQNVQFNYNGKVRRGVAHSLEIAKTGNELLTLDLGADAIPPFKSFIVENIEGDIRVVE